MPNEIIDEVVKDTDLSKKEAEALWDKAAKQAEKSDKTPSYGYIMTIFKSMLGKSNVKKLGWKAGVKMVKIKTKR